MKKAIPWLLGLGALGGLLLLGGKKKQKEGEVPLPQVEVEPGETPGTPQPQPPVALPSGTYPSTWLPPVTIPTSYPTPPVTTAPPVMTTPPIVTTPPVMTTPPVATMPPVMTTPPIVQTSTQAPAPPVTMPPIVVTPETPTVPPIVEQPSVTAADTAALAKLMLTDEAGPNWKRKLPQVMTWQAKRELTADGKYGPGTALRMAQEIGTIPIVRFWPSGSQKEPAVQAFRELLAEEAATAPEPRKSQLYAAIEREQGQGFGRGQEAIKMLIELGVAA